MKYIALVIIILCLLVAPLVSAENNTTGNMTVNPTQNLTQNVTQNVTQIITPVVTRPLTTPEEFYGNATYSDGSPIAAGSEIIAKNQTGFVIGKFTMTVNGSYGDEYKSAPRLLVYAQSPNDEISFYVGTAKSTGKTMKFNIGSIKRVDIIISSNEKPTPVHTTIPTTIPTAAPTTVATKIITTIATPVPTTVPTVAPTTVATTIVPTQAPYDATPKFVGVLLVSIAICVVGAILTYFILTKKMKREDEEEINL